jgi:hypothetical protein
MTIDSIDEQLDALIAEAKQLISSYSPQKSQKDCSYYSRRSFPGKEPIRTIFNDVPMRTRLFERVKQAPQGQQPRMKNLFFWLMQESDLLENRAKHPEEVFQEALARTWEYFIKNFNDYAPERASPTTWFKGKLEFSIVDVYRVLGRDKNLTTRLIPYVQQDSNDSQIHEELLKRIYQYLMDNKDDLKRKRMSKYPQVDCYLLFNQRLPRQDTYSDEFLEGESWDKILERLGLAQGRDLRQELSRFYRRQCLPCLRKFLEEQGY